MLKRKFTRRQKIIAALSFDDRCQVCNRVLKKGWHADHIHPFSKGGKTDLSNLHPLCPSCNLKKSNKEYSMEVKMKLWPWQHEAAEVIASKLNRENDRKALVSAGVGSGKTFFASHVFSQHFSKHWNSVVIISPTVNISREWSKTMKLHFGFDIDYGYTFNYSWRADFNGISITYQSLNNAVNFEALLRRTNRQTLLIIDEVHHAAEDKSWGVSIEQLGMKAGFVLSLTGTPFRTDNSRIPFCTYQETSPEEKTGYDRFKLLPDYTYSYSDSVKDNICCPIRFHNIKARLEYDNGDIRWLRASEPKYKAKSSVYKALSVNKLGEDCLVMQMWEKGNILLNQLCDRRGNGYGGLVVCKRIEHAKQLHENLTTLYGDDIAVIAHSDNNESDQVIEDFKKSDTPWIITVKMVSEGVNISRIRVIVYATNSITEQLVTQILGRGVRGADHRANDLDVCHCVIYEYGFLMEICLAIEESISDININKPLITKCFDTTTEPRETTPNPTLFDPEIIGIETGENGSLYRSLNYEKPLEDRIEIESKRLRISPETTMDLIRSFHLENNTSDIFKQQSPNNTQPLDKTKGKKDLRTKIQKLVGRAAAITGEEFSHIHARFNEIVAGKGVGTNQLSMDQLKNKRSQLQNYIDGL